MAILLVLVVAGGLLLSRRNLNPNYTEIRQTMALNPDSVKLAPGVEEHVQVGGSTREKVELQDGPDGVVCAPGGHRHTQACIYPCTNVQACAS